MANGNDAEPHQEQAESGYSIVNAISLLVVVGFLAAFATIQFIIPDGVKPEVLSIINILVGALVASFTTVVNYHIGSTKTSARSADTNRETIKSLANTAASTASTAATVANTAATVAAAPAVAAAAAAGTGGAPTTVTTTTETRVDPAPAPPKADDAEIAITALDIAAQQGSVRALDAARENLGQTVPAKVEAHYAELRDRLIAQLQSGNTPPKS